MKKLFLLIQFILLNTCAFCQLLTVEQTIEYLNTSSKKLQIENAIRKDGCADYIYDEISISSDGIITINKYGAQGCVAILYATYQFHYSDIAPPIWGNPISSVGADTRWYYTTTYDFELRCFGTCIKGIFYYGRHSFHEKFEKFETTHTGFTDSFVPQLVEDSYTRNKIINAYKYLFEIIKESGKYERIDSDPFATKNLSEAKKIDITISNNLKPSDIRLNKLGELFTLPVQVGSRTKNFILDSGAGEMQLSPDFLAELIKDGTVTKDDILSSGLYKIADGSIVACKRVNIKKLKVGNFVVSNVTASVGEAFDTPLLLGKSFFDKFKKWSIDNTNSTLHLEK
jgi:predicted aspartyl protease